MRSNSSLDMLLASLRRRQAFVTLLQETWRCGTEMIQQDGFVFIGAGPQQQSRRGSRGVGIVLSGLALGAWQRAGHELHNDAGDRLIAVRLEVRDERHRSRRLGLFIISGYAPTSGHPMAELVAYYEGFSRLLARARPGDIVVCGVDANASIGRGRLGQLDDGERQQAGAVGAFGLEHVNQAGRRLRTFLESHQLASLASFYGKAHYSTWQHPRTHRGYQLDHLLVSCSDRRRFADAGSCPFQLIASDHRAVGGRMRFATSLQRRPDPRADMLRPDYSALSSPAGQEAFARDVLARLGVLPAQSAQPERDYDGRVIMGSAGSGGGGGGGDRSGGGGGGSADSSDDVQQHHGPTPAVRASRDGCKFGGPGLLCVTQHVSLDIAVSDDGRASLSFSPQPTYSQLASALRQTVLETLPAKPKPQPPWFEACAPQLLALIGERDTASAVHATEQSGESAARLRVARRRLQAAVRDATSSWIVARCETVNATITSAHGVGEAWKIVGELKSGLMGATRQPVPAKMRKPDGSLATSPDENAEVFRVHFKALFGRAPTDEPNYDPSIIDALRQRLVVEESGALPTDVEIRRALGKLRNSGPGDSGLPARVWKALGSTAESFSLVRQMVLNFWETEVMPAEWDIGLLKILPKKGDKSVPGNYRGIMLLEVAYKIIANIVLMRLSPIINSREHLDHETQCGFRSGLGTADASFTVKQLIRKRREHGLETWILFVDLVKAFDRVPRELLWLVLLKYGVSPKLVSLLKAMHNHVLVNFLVDGILSTLLSIIGVKQGDLLGPPLFIFYMAAIMETWRASSSYELCAFRTRRDFVMTGRTHRCTGEDFTVPGSEYADDGAFTFCSRADGAEQTPRLMLHFGRWGMEVHAGVLAPPPQPTALSLTLSADGSITTTIAPLTAKVIKESKTEMLFCAAPAHCYTDPSSFDGADLSLILLPDNRFVAVVDRFPYLGDIVSRTGDDALAVEARVLAGSRAFGALRSCVFASPSMSRVAKKAVYESVVMSVALYGSESWSLREPWLQQLRVMQAFHLRVMSRTTRTHTWRHHISTQELGRELGIDSIDTLVARRQLRWLGHVSRMDWQQRLPRRMLSSWVPCPRPVGAPAMTYGRSIGRALDHFHIAEARWHELAADRGVWRGTLADGFPPPAFRPPPPPPPPPPISQTRPTRRAAAAANMAMANATAHDQVLQRRISDYARSGTQRGNAHVPLHATALQLGTANNGSGRRTPFSQAAWFLSQAWVLSSQLPTGVTLKIGQMAKGLQELSQEEEVEAQMIRELHAEMRDFAQRCQWDADDAAQDYMLARLAGNLAQRASYKKRVEDREKRAKRMHVNVKILGEELDQDKKGLDRHLHGARLHPSRH